VFILKVLKAVDSNLVLRGFVLLVLKVTLVRSRSLSVYTPGLRGRFGRVYACKQTTLIRSTLASPRKLSKRINLSRNSFITVRELLYTLLPC
jgi:hypothetical protein